VKFLLALAAFSAALGAATVNAVAAYPDRPVRMIVPYPPGGGNDTLARLFGMKLTEAWGQQVVVDNRPGAGTIIGTQIAARAVPDGYTLLLSSIATHAIAPNLYAKPGYDPVKDFSPVTLPAVPAKSLKELIALAKARPGELKFASGGLATPPHMAGEIFASMTGIRLIHVPYKGGGPAIVGLIGGEATMMFDTAASILPHVQSGKLRALAIARSARLAEYPNLPTFTEAGVAGYEVNAWYSVHAPAGVPKDVIAKVNRDLVRALKQPDIQERLKVLGSEGVGDTPEHFAAFVRSESAKYAKAIREAGVKVE